MFELPHSLDFVSVVIVVIFFLLVGYRPPWWLRKSGEFKTSQVVPGPIALPLIGTGWIFWFGSYSVSGLHEYYKDLKKRFGGIVKEEALFNIPIINVFEKDDIEKVLKSSGKYPLRPPTESIAHYRRSKPERYASAGLVNEQGRTWHHLRSSLTSDLTSPRTISGFLPEVSEISEDWCSLIKQVRDEDERILDLNQFAGRLGLEATCALVLGRRMGFLLAGGESFTARKLAEAVQNHFIATRDTYYGLPLWKFFPTPAYKKLCDSEEAIYQLALELIQSADDSVRESAVFQAVLKADVDEKEKTAAIVDFIAAGIHTLRNSLIFLLQLVAKDPNIQRKILEDSSGNYVRACINESFRLIPTAMCLARITEEDLILSGHKIAAGSVVLCQTGIACQDDRYFSNATSYRPERWLNEEEKIETSSNASFLVSPFGAGRRICPGKRFIEQVLPIILSATVRNFELFTEKKLEVQFEFLLAPKGPVSMTFKDRV